MDGHDADRFKSLDALTDRDVVGGLYLHCVVDEVAVEGVIDRLLLALAAQLDASGNPALAAGAVEAFADLSRAEVDVIFGQAGLLVHYGSDTGPLEALIESISAVQRAEAPADAPVRPGDKVRLVGALPDSFAECDEASVREAVFVVRSCRIRFTTFSNETWRSMQREPRSVAMRPSRTMLR